MTQIGPPSRPGSNPDLAHRRQGATLRARRTTLLKLRDYEMRVQKLPNP